jgi:hypothetical protein
VQVEAVIMQVRQVESQDRQALEASSPNWPEGQAVVQAEPFQ